MAESNKKQIVEPMPIRGFREWLPEERILEQKILDTIRKEYESHGFLPIETSAVERNEILLSKGGISSKEIYQLTRLAADKEEKEKDRSYSLHFDLTVPFARYTAQNYGKLIFPFKRYQIQKVWRGEKPGKGRFREFYQADIDVIGNETLSISYDAEVLSVVHGVFSKLNIGEFVIRVNNRKLHKGLIQKYNLPSASRIEKLKDALQDIRTTEAYDVKGHAIHLLTKEFHLDDEGREAAKIFSWFMGDMLKEEEIIEQFKKFEEERVIRHLDGIDKVSREELFNDLTNKLDIESDTANDLLNFAKLEKSHNIPQDELLEHLKTFCDNPIYQEGIHELETLLEESYSLGVPKHRIALDPKIARGLNYYTGVIYETDLLADKELGSVCSGGRFDDLAGQFIDRKLPGVGISIGVTRLVSAILEKKLLPIGSATIAPVMLAIKNQAVKHDILQLAKRIREAGVPCEVSFLNDLGKQLKYAGKKGFKYVVIASLEEIAEGKVCLRDMNKPKEEAEEILSIEDLIKKLC